MKIYDYEGKKNVCGTNIREARVIRRISQTELAARMQLEGILLERDSISRIENGVRFVAVIRSHKHGLYFIFAVLKQKAQGLAGKTAVRAQLFAQFYVGVYSRLLVFESARKYEVGGKEIVRRVVGALKLI